MLTPSTLTLNSPELHSCDCRRVNLYSAHNFADGLLPSSTSTNLYESIPLDYNNFNPTFISSICDKTNGVSSSNVNSNQPSPKHEVYPISKVYSISEIYLISHTVAVAEEVHMQIPSGIHDETTIRQWLNSIDLYPCDTPVVTPAVNFITQIQRFWASRYIQKGQDESFDMHWDLASFSSREDESVTTMESEWKGGEGSSSQLLSVDSFHFPSSDCIRVSTDSLLIPSSSCIGNCKECDSFSEEDSTTPALPSPDPQSIRCMDMEELWDILLIDSEAMSGLAELRRSAPILASCFSKRGNHFSPHL